MKKMSKKILSIVLCALVPAGTAAVMTANLSQTQIMAHAAAAQTDFTSGDYSYKLADNSNAVITRYNGSDKTIIVPSTIDGYTVKGIGDYAFSGCSSITDVTIPQGITSIGIAAFVFCNGLESVSIPDSVTNIGSSAFFNCTALTGIVLPDGIQAVPDYLCYGCIRLSDASLPDSAESIGTAAFYNCQSLESISLPGNLTSVGNSAFDSCTSLCDLTLPESVKSIGNSSFFACDGIQTIDIPAAVTDIGAYAFRSCSELTSINVSADNNNYSSENGILFNKNKTTLMQYPEGKTETAYTVPVSVTKIDRSAFENADDLVSVLLPEKLTLIDEKAFLSCSSLKSITIPDSVVTIGNNAFEKCAKLGSVDVPDNVGTIGEEAFKDCAGLKSITIPNSVTSIGYEAFYGCSSLDDVSVPYSIKQIEGRTFGKCSSLRSIMIPDNVITISDSAFVDCTDLTIYGKPGYHAEAFAQDHGFDFKESSKATSVTKITFDTVSVTVKKGNNMQINATIYPADASDKTLKWIASDSSVATVSDGKVTAVGIGTATITAKTTSGKTTSCKIIVNETDVNELRNNSWINSEKVQIGDDIRVEGAAEGGEGGYKYAFYFKRSTNSKWNKIGTEFGTKTYGIVIPKAAADYDIRVIVKDSAGNTAEKVFKVTTVENLPLTNISYLNTENVPVGKTVTAVGSFVGGTKPVTYEFYFKRSTNTKWNKLSYGNERCTYAKFTPTAAASYDIKVTATDSKGNKVSKTMKLTAG